VIIIRPVGGLDASTPENDTVTVIGPGMYGPDESEIFMVNSVSPQLVRIKVIMMRIMTNTIRKGVETDFVFIFSPCVETWSLLLIENFSKCDLYHKVLVAHRSLKGFFDKPLSRFSIVQEVTIRSYHLHTFYIIGI